MRSLAYPSLNTTENKNKKSFIYQKYKIQELKHIPGLKRQKNVYIIHILNYSIYLLIVFKTNLQKRCEENFSIKNYPSLQKPFAQTVKTENT